MTVNREKTPPCFGDLETVFPEGAEGLRETPQSCMICCYKTPCLRSAIADGGGIKLREEMVDRAYASGMVSFFERWSRKKALHAHKQDRDKS